MADVDLDNGVITIRGTKFYKSRLVPLGRDVVRLLREYLATPGRWNQHYQPVFQSRHTSASAHNRVEAIPSGGCATLRVSAAATRVLISRGSMTCGTRSPSTG